MNINKIVVSGVVAVTLFGATIASAQTYSSMYNYASGYSGACVNLASDISYGQRGSNVSQLQNFLVSQNYPGGGSWMVTGYFGSATVAAVRNFQQTQGLSMTGAVDASTRSAIARVSCGTNYNYNNNYTLPYNNYSNAYPYNYNGNYNYNNYNSNQYPYNYPYNYGNYNFFNSYGATPVLTSLSVTSAPAGAPVTIFGTGFDPSNNTVYVGGTTLSNISSGNTTSLTFTVPSSTNGATSVSVGNSHGMSNALTLTVGSYGYPYNNPSPCGSTYGYSYNCPPNTGVPIISYLSPASGSIGTYVTVYGSGFSSTGNTVHFGNGIISNLSSYDGRSVSFTVPSTVSGYGYQPIGLGTYNVSVSNSAGATSNMTPFTITSLGTTVAPTITSVNGPTSLGVGVSGTWTIAVNNPNAAYLTTSVRWGDEGTYGYQAGAAQTQVQNQATLAFTHTYYTSGTYTVTFTVSNGADQQNTSSATVYVSGSGNTGSVSLSYLSPSFGHVGTQIQIIGSGFSAIDNTLHFGNGGSQHVPSINGTTIYYTVPSYLSPCDVNIVAGTACPMYAQQVTPGSYPIYVTSPSGTSNTMNFQVQ